MHAAASAAVATAVLAVVTSVALFVPRISQPQEYHDFADQRELIPGVPNTLDVLSNAPFLVIGLVGLAFTANAGDSKFSSQAERYAWATLFAGVTATSAGSSYYHLAPTDSTLTWDRLPMTIAFTAVLSVMIGERVHKGLGASMLLPAVVAGAASVLYWRYTDDLRWYLLVQLAPIVACPVLLLVTEARYTHTTHWSMAAGK
eukprot:jgi/Chlat1/4860/Chrsp31S08940